MALVEREDRDAVRRLVLNAPDRLNPLSRAMIAALSDELDALREATDVRAVILSGAGRAFCAGHDLSELSAARQSEDGGRAALKALFDDCAAMMLRIRAVPQPVIAQVHGLAAAAGCQLVASCDMAVAAEDARFGVNGVNIGLFCSTPMVALSRNVPPKQAFEMLTTGGFVDAARSRDLGLVNRVVAPGDLAHAADDLAQTVAAKLGSAVRIGKRAFYDQLEMPVEAAYAFTGQAMVENMMDAGTAEGISAFLEKRAPDWRQ